MILFRRTVISDMMGKKLTDYNGNLNKKIRNNYPFYAAV